MFIESWAFIRKLGALAKQQTDFKSSVTQCFTAMPVSEKADFLFYLIVYL